MAKRRFEFPKGASNKFWEISVEGNNQTIHYGRIGAKGQEKTKSFTSKEEAEKDAENLVEEKLKEGYRELLATNARVCPICGNNPVYCWSVPSRPKGALYAGFCRCAKCNYVWQAFK